jgi:hypothetical protein
MPCSPLKVKRRYGGTYRLHLHSRISQARNQRDRWQATCSSETSVDFQRTTRRYIPDNRALHNHRCEKLKSNKNYINQKHLTSITRIAERLLHMYYKLHTITICITRRYYLQICYQYFSTKLGTTIPTQAYCLLLSYTAPIRNY